MTTVRRIGASLFVWTVVALMVAVAIAEAAPPSREPP
jgi:hypothetical protein